MSKLFNTVKIRKPKSSAFNLSHEKKLTLNMGELVPVVTAEVIPGTKWRCNSEFLCRMHQTLAPIMHRIDATIHYFYVPNRLVFKNWDKFITGGEDGNDNTPMPFITLDPGREAQIKNGTLSDYLGIPTADGITIVGAETVSALPFRAYQLIYNEYYRDQNLTTKVPITTDDVVGTTEEDALLQLRRRSWQKDYFTSALPWAQKGGEVLMPMVADVTYKDPTEVKFSVLGTPVVGTDTDMGVNTSGHVDNVTQPTTEYIIDNIESIENATTTINDLRTATRVQEWLEKNARAGSRLFESILAHFGVVSDDLRIGRPKYLGGGRVPVTVSEVLSHFESTETDLGQMGGHLISAGNNAGFKAYFKEHGWVMGILSITPKPAYQQGLPKMFKRFDKFDFAWPEFANLGEQAIENRELFMDWGAAGSGGANTATFGYTPRYAEYKYINNTVHGDFKESLSFWHCGRIFQTRPNLNGAFIECNTAEIDDRIFPVADAQATDKCYVQLYNNISAVMPLPYYGTPRL